jgi:hypothetical protein
VESDEALRAFEREIASLEQAFKDSGYESAKLDLAQGNGQQGNGAQEEENPFYSARLAADKAASRYEGTLERTDASSLGLSQEGFKPRNGRISVNMLI